MRKLALLAAALVAGSSAASAAPVLYGISFVGTGSYADPGFSGVLNGAPRDFTGTFTFDESTNQLLGFSAEFIGPRATFPSPLALFEAAQPCDLQCFVGALATGSFSYSYGNGSARISFGDPLSGTVFAPALANLGDRAGVTGVIRFNGAIPEPETWLMMLLGFGAVGASIRRCRQSVQVVSA